MKTEVVILANGSFPKNKDVLKVLATAKYLICCDGAMNKLEQVGLRPHVIVGDLDSIKDSVKEKYADILYHISEQSTNDLTKAINWCLDNGFTQAVILGATGEREDHAIANIFLLLRYAKMMEVSMLTDYGVFVPLLKSTRLDSFEGQQISIFSPYEQTRLTTVGLKYPVVDSCLPELWQGSLNESLGDSFEIDFEGNGLVVFLKNNTEV